jgi:hypothetical protein
MQIDSAIKIQITDIEAWGHEELMIISVILKVFYTYASENFIIEHLKISLKFYYLAHLYIILFGLIPSLF